MPIFLMKRAREKAKGGKLCPVSSIIVTNCKLELMRKQK